METALISFVMTSATIGVGALAAIHFIPDRVHKWIDSYHDLIDYNPVPAASSIRSSD